MFLLQLAVDAAAQLGRSLTESNSQCMVCASAMNSAASRNECLTKPL